MKFLISDLHLGHTKISEYRGFSSVEDMHQKIVDSWNSVVTSNDQVYVLGDVAMSKKSLNILSLLRGKKILIKGNHDIYDLKSYQLYFKDVRGAHEIDSVILTHIPVHPSQLRRYKANIHGHLHNNRIINPYTSEYDERYVNVCVEQVDYVPVALDYLLCHL